MFASKIESQFILLFSLFLLLFMSSTALFGTFHESHCIISANFYFYLQYFQQKVFNFNKISRSQTDPKFEIVFILINIHNIFTTNFKWHFISLLLKICCENIVKNVKDITLLYFSSLN